MILCNTTFCVDDNIARDFCEFVRDVYIAIAEESAFHAFVLSELRVPTETNTLTGQPTHTLALQMKAGSQADVDKFKEGELPAIYKEMGRRWGPAVTMFETELDILFDSER